VSENDDSYCAGTTKVEVMSHGKERLKRKAFKRPWKTAVLVLFYLYNLSPLSFHVFCR